MAELAEKWPDWNKHSPIRITDLGSTPSLARHPRQVDVEVISTVAKHVFVPRRQSFVRRKAPVRRFGIYDSLEEKRHIGYPVNPRYYDDVATLNRDLKATGYKAQTYLFPYFYVGSENFAYGSERDYFVKNRFKENYLIPFHTVDDEIRQPTTRMAGIIDFTNPSALEWYQEIIRQIVVELDFDGWMHDFGEDVPEDAVFYNGKSGAEMHNIYPVLYQKATCKPP